MAQLFLDAILMESNGQRLRRNYQTLDCVYFRSVYMSKSHHIFFQGRFQTFFWGGGEFSGRLQRERDLLSRRSLLMNFLKRGGGICPLFHP